MQNCIFCKIIEKEAKANILLENGTCSVFTPINPIAKGHVLIIPKIHFKDIFDIDEKILSALAVTAKKFAHDIVKEHRATGINLLHASGKDAQQSIFHFHFHLVPRYPNDELDLWLRNRL